MNYGQDDTGSRWWDTAACIGADPSLFDGMTSGRPSLIELDRVETVLDTFCRRCPAASPCLADAIANGDVGIRGGQMLVRERDDRVMGASA